MQRKPFFSRPWVNNLLWLLASLMIAFWIWVIATFDQNPIQPRTFTNLAVHVLLDDGMMLVSPQRSSVVRVTLRAQQSVLNALNREIEIIVEADLRGLEPGTHTVPITVQVLRPAVVEDIQPLAIEYQIDSTAEKQVPLVWEITAEPPVGFERADPVFSTTQVIVRGASAQVSRVQAVRLQLDLSRERDSFVADLVPLPIDNAGNVVDAVDTQPDRVNVSVDIRTPADTIQVPVTLDLDTRTLPDGYVLTSETNYSPQTVLVTGPENLLAGLSIVRTEPISLAERTGSFEVTVRVVLPDQRLSIVGDDRITVQVGITALTTSRQFENVRVEVFGLPAGYDVTITPQQVTVLLTGPQPLIDNLTANDIVAVINLEGRTTGTYALAPVVAVNMIQVSPENISVFPSEIEVQITEAGEVTTVPPETTQEPGG